MTFVSYAQNFEDVILWRALKHIKNGTYIDIGAQDPVTHSVSLAFYENGWRGVHVEPSAAYAEKIRKARPDEEVIQAAVGAKSGEISFFDIPDTGLSTGDEAIAKQHKAAGFKPHRTTVNCLPLSQILEPFKKRDVHWLKIDVEGMEHLVIKSWGKSSVRPWIVVVESTKPLSTEASHGEWEGTLKTLGYDFAYFDGLNRFYTSRKHKNLSQVFGPGPNVFDDYQPYIYVSAITENSKLQQEITDLCGNEKNNRSSIEVLTIENANLKSMISSKTRKIDSQNAKISLLELKATRNNEEIREKGNQIIKLKSSMADDKKVSEFLAWRLSTVKNFFVKPSQNRNSIGMYFKSNARTRTVDFRSIRQSKILALEIPKPQSPSELGLGPDERQLGIGLISLEIVTRNMNKDRKTINFSSNQWPDFVKRVDGLCTPEKWGAWSSRDAVVIEFADVLPESFVLNVKGIAYGQNIGRPVLVNVMEMNAEAVKSARSNIARFGRKNLRLIVLNFWKKIRPQGTDESLDVEFMLEPSKKNVAAWQKLLSSKIVT